MKTSNQVQQLWEELRNFVDATYLASKAAPSDDPRFELRDYARDITWSDATAALLDAETKNEKQHRGGRRIDGFSPATAAKLILCGNFIHGTQLKAMPDALVFLRYRKTSAEMLVVGYLCREAVTQDWRDRVESLDYAKLMRDAA